MAAVMWVPQSASGMKMSFEIGLYTFPEVLGADNTGWFLMVGIPFNFKP